MSKIRGMIRAGVQALNEPLPARFLAVRALDAVLDFLPYERKIHIGSVARAHYGFGLLHAARLANRLGLKRISALEFGVAGGNGLLALEAHAARVTRETGVEVEIFGFDTGAGLPPPADYRDLPYAWETGFYAMNAEQLEKRLRSASLIIGDVRETTRRFHERNAPPIGFIVFDLDYYSSTMAALEIFALESSRLLPRVFCYFDDVAGGPGFCYNEFTGELLAIQEFNAAHTDRKIARLAGLRYHVGSLPARWHEQMYVAHLFAHPQYNVPAHRGEDYLGLR
jgi:hypothetical protein